MRPRSQAGDPHHPANFGRLCSKGSALADTIDLDGRLLKPSIHGRDTTWDEALDEIAIEARQLDLDDHLRVHARHQRSSQAITSRSQNAARR